MFNQAVLHHQQYIITIAQRTDEASVTNQRHELTDNKRSREQKFLVYRSEYS